MTFILFFRFAKKCFRSIEKSLIIVKNLSNSFLIKLTFLFCQVIQKISKYEFHLIRIQLLADRQQSGMLAHFVSLLCIHYKSQARQPRITAKGKCQFIQQKKHLFGKFYQFCITGAQKSQMFPLSKNSRTCSKLDIAI